MKSVEILKLEKDIQDIFISHLWDIKEVGETSIKNECEDLFDKYILEGKISVDIINDYRDNLFKKFTLSYNSAN